MTASPAVSFVVRVQESSASLQLCEARLAESTGMTLQLQGEVQQARQQRLEEAAAAEAELAAATTQIAALNASLQLAQVGLAQAQSATCQQEQQMKASRRLARSLVPGSARKTGSARAVIVSDFVSRSERMARRQMRGCSARRPDCHPVECRGV